MNTTIAAARATTTTTSTGTWAVLDRDGRVVVLFGGGEAKAEAERWKARGYRAAKLTD